MHFPYTFTEPHLSHEARIIDVRTIVPRERHPLIFSTFHGLQPGGAFLLVNDHDPKPLYYQFKAELGESFQWDYLESGPDVWKVRIARPA